MVQTFRGYGRVAADGSYVAFLFIAAIMNLVYLQLYSTFSVFLRDVHGISPRDYGFLMSLNATLVVIAQFWVTRRVKRFPPMLMMALGTALYMIGFSLYGFVAAFGLFAVAMLIITVGEMIVMPTAQALAARFAPEDMRGRYMAIFSMCWTIPAAIGPWAAGLIMDNVNPNWVWYLAGTFSLVAVIGFLGLHLRTRTRLAPRPEAATPVAAM
jgi:MFS family permease